MIHAKDVIYKVDDFSLKKVSLYIGNGKYFVLAGPAGSGKSVFLECLCGIRRIESGKIFIDGKDVTMLEPRYRNVGYVPQDYALFSHLTAGENIGFALKVQGEGKDLIEKQVSGIAQTLAIEDILERDVSTLSAGQRQRVALARALVAEPSVLLLDEPVCALDEAHRQEVCALLRMIANDFKLTVIHVCHNLEEAFTVADSAAVLRDGHVEQSGDIKDLLRKPANEFVGRFMRCENIFSCKTTGAIFPGGTEVKFGNQLLVLPGSLNSKVRFMIRPENIELFNFYSNWHEDENMLPVNVLGYRDFGSYVRLELDGPALLVANVNYNKFQHLDIFGSKRLLAWLPRKSIYVLEDEQGE